MSKILKLSDGLIKILAKFIKKVIFDNFFEKIFKMIRFNFTLGNFFNDFRDKKSEVLYNLN